MYEAVRAYLGARKIREKVCLEKIARRIERQRERESEREKKRG